MTLISALLAVIFALIAVVSGLWTKKNNAEALNQNADVKNQINASNTEVAKDQGLVQAEAEKRAELEREKAASDAKETTVQDDLDKLNGK